MGRRGGGGLTGTAVALQPVFLFKKRKKQQLKTRGFLSFRGDKIWSRLLFFYVVLAFCFR